MGVPEPEDPAGFTRPARFVRIEDHPLEYANVFVVQGVPDGFYVTFGQARPPVLIGDPSDQRSQAERVDFVPVEVIARLVVPRERLIELRAIIDTELKRGAES